MYNNFFGFKEKPFKLVPNPAYLFLSKSHEEALAHLNYAVSQGDGFVEITGEVGTGKTTLCRAFLESLSENTVAAYIFNPRLGPKQLIKTINDEFGIKYDADNTKDLIDKLNAFLLLKKTQRKRVIVLIDEAQNLSRNVLEQLRLLSNLETNQEKLVQIILVGQPELAEMLDSYELRQLGQRITLRYLLLPLNYKETIGYIHYRLNIASKKNKSIRFDRSALRHIYKYSRGIPRVINIACDRTLLTAFGLNQLRVSGSIARASIKELTSRGTGKRFSFVKGNKAVVILAGLCIGLFMVIFYQQLHHGIQTIFKSPEIKESAALPPAGEVSGAALDPPGNQISAEPVEPEIALKPPIPLPKETRSLADYLSNDNLRASRQTALQHAMNLWHTPVDLEPYLSALDDDLSFFRLSAKPAGLFIHRIEADLNMLSVLNLPAILEFYQPSSQQPAYLTLSKIDGNRIVLGGVGDGEEIVADPDEINFYWSGIAYIPWKNFLSIWGTIPFGSFQDSVITLKLLLRDIGFNDVEINADYDDPTQKAVENIQTKYGIPVDGFVGPLTKMILYREKNSFNMPRLAN
jgi:general secretion pathway protein A